MTIRIKLGESLVEIKDRVGASWESFTVYGATVDGIAPPKEPPGKNPEKYKQVPPGSIFYNPMRILIGSVAYLSEDNASGMTSPDYVVLRGKEGIVDTHWFYYWLRSPFGHDCIMSLARGAVRERMLFNRLAEAEVEFPSFEEQQRYSAILSVAQCEADKIRNAIDVQRNDLNQLPHRIVAQSLEGVS